MTKKIQCCISVDIDAVAGWLGSYGGEDSTSDISRGMFAGTVGVRRMLRLFKKHNIKTTWFIPGHSLETFPEECRMVAEGGHEIGLHGYSHENPRSMTLEQQTVVMDKCYRLIQDFQGRPPRGIVAPWWEASKEGAELMLKYGLEYDHSFSHHDAQPYYLRTGDEWDVIKFENHPDTWMKPLRKGQFTGLVEIGASWYLDDLPPLMFIKGSHNSHGWVDTSVVEKLWREHFDFYVREIKEEEAGDHDPVIHGVGNGDVGAVFAVTTHPDVSGHPHGILMVERMIEYINSQKDVEVEWVTMEQICDTFKKNNPTPPAGSLLPAKPGAILQDKDLKLEVQQ
ncbi:hypothetical protein CAC42_1557 [Sphaceloma murrayae]|uniref:NodB homology domain-containing protein n=1 Tax=Sphaceloma murrayae TaxID=2082308 RepID=A0A2K1R3D8_9PEZI|nr:hypothetical protein CAC42_1557 [Sphaceloma murrayae]